jgi:hypothetical protein
MTNAIGDKPVVVIYALKNFILIPRIMLLSNWKYSKKQ